jgi:hypothetical protein
MTWTQTIDHVVQQLKSPTPGTAKWIATANRNDEVASTNGIAS